MKKSIAVIAAHPDDEVLGCGASIASHIQNGDDVHVLILAEGQTSRANQRDRVKHAVELNALAADARKAHDILGTTSLVLHDFPDNRMDSVDLLEIVKVIEQFLTKYAATIIYTHHAGDVNIDHRCVHDAVIAACRPQPGNKVEQLLFFEVPSSTEWRPPHSSFHFMPNWFIDISDTLKMKLQALEAYSSEMRPWPHARSMQAVEHLARWRGATIGVEAAEAFNLGRYIGRKHCE